MGPPPSGARAGSIKVKFWSKLRINPMATTISQPPILGDVGVKPASFIWTLVISGAFIDV